MHLFSSQLIVGWSEGKGAWQIKPLSSVGEVESGQDKQTSLCSWGLFCLKMFPPISSFLLNGGQSHFGCLFGVFLLISCEKKNVLTLISANFFSMSNNRWPCDSNAKKCFTDSFPEHLPHILCYGNRRAQTRQDFL